MREPHSGPQDLFHRSNAFEVLYGGAAGGGKTFSLVFEAIRQIGNPFYSGIIFRRTYPQLEGPGGPIEISESIYPQLGGQNSRHEWIFPSKARILFRHMANEKDYLNYQGHQYTYVGFDELAHFTEMQYRYLFSRVRVAKDAGLRAYVRATSNPPEDYDPGRLWIKKRWAAWLDPSHKNPAKPGEVRYYKLVNDTEIEVDKEEKEAWSRTFIPASYKDNPSLDESYERNLDMLPLVQRKRLKEGDWGIKAESGKIVDRRWFDGKILREFPAGLQYFRYWDLAATEQKSKGDDPDYTATCKMGFTLNPQSEHYGKYFLEIKRNRLNVGKVLTWILGIAQREPGVEVGIEQEPGASGKYAALDIVTKIGAIGSPAKAWKPSGDKVQRGLAWTRQAEAGNVYIVENNETNTDDIIDEFATMPDGPHDDMFDTVSGCWAMKESIKKAPAKVGYFKL